MTWQLGAGLADRSVLVTGGAGAIGREVAAAFAAAGARVAVADLDQAAVDAVVAGLDDPGRHVALAVDLAEPDAPALLVARVRDALGRIDVLAHLAAVIRRQPDLDAVTPEDWEAQHDVNLRAAFFLNRAAAQAMREQGDGGRIVNFTSQGWWTGGFGGSVVYAASKGGVVSMSRGLARTYGPHGILVNCVAPGAVDTPMLRDGMSDEALEAFRAQIPLGRFAEPGEVAGAVVFLASDHATYISGAVLNVSGGQLMY
jgi:NAD(P)-dependent dehydrogenase (short-subunit alcohol dehydrogenase family)